jgi:uncharacterized membrane protein (DUF2068 family)
LKEAQVNNIILVHQALKLTPDNPNLHAGLAIAYEAIDKAKAEDEWKKAKGSGRYYLYKNKAK